MDTVNPLPLLNNLSFLLRLPSPVATPNFDSLFFPIPRLDIKTFSILKITHIEKGPMLVLYKRSVYAYGPHYSSSRYSFIFATKT